MPSPGIEIIDAPYRRGLVLGLTLAELFLLLLFVLLLALALIYTGFGEKLSAVQSDLQNTRQELKDLSSFRDEVEAVAGSENDRLGEILSKVRNAGQVATRNEQLILDLSNAEKILEREKERRRTAEEDLAKLEKQLEQLETDISDQTQERSEEKSQIAELKKQITNLQQKYSEAMAALAGTKAGIDPSCWYRQETRASGQKPREVFLFDIAVFEGSLVIRDRHDVPEYYIEEKERLPLEQIAFNTPLSDAEFLAQTEPIKRMAQEGMVRDYRCVFHVLVYDQIKTEGARERWKKATEEVIGENFYRLTVRNEHW